LPRFASIFAFLAGALVTVQAGSNAQLKLGFGTPMPALLVNYVLGWRGAWIGISNFSGLGDVKNAFGIRIGIVHTATNTI